MVLVYIANIDNLKDPIENPELLEGLPEDRKEKIGKIKVSQKRKQSFGAGLLLEHAKKEFQKHSVAETMRYNLSHSGDYAICAVGTKPVGCDIEKVKEAPLKVAQRYFCQSEVDYLNSVDSSAVNEEFFRIWTIKESYTKMMGKGLSLGLNSFKVDFADEICLTKDEQKLNCYIKEYDLEGYKISVCSEDNSYKNELILVDL